MKANLKSRSWWIEHVAWISALALSLVLVGCGEHQSDSDGVIVKNPQRSAPVPTLQPHPPEVAQVPTPAVPEDTVVSEPELVKQVSFEDAETAFHEKRYGDAVELFTRYTERKSENPWGFYMLGLSAWQSGDFDKAQIAFERAIELDPRHVKSYLNLGRVLIDSGEPEEALIPLRKALEIDPESSVAYRLKGRVFDDIRQRPQAVESYQRAIQIDNTDAWSMNNLGLVLIEEGLYGQALLPLARAVEIDSTNAKFFNNLGMALEHVGHFRAAEQAYASSVTLDESFEKAGFNLARVQEVREELDLEPVDLTEIALAFVEVIQSWTVTVVGETQPESPSVAATDQPETAEPESETDEESDPTGEGQEE